MTSQALVLKFNTDLAQAQRNIALFAVQAGRDIASVATAAVKTRDTLELLSRAGSSRGLVALSAGALAAVVALKAVPAALDAAGEKLAGLNKIGADAAKAGVGATFFQSYTQQAKEFGHEVSDLTAQLEKFREASTTRIGEDGGEPINAGRDRIRQNVLAGFIGAQAVSNFDAADTS
ncbi:MAG: hypothetical protein ACT4O2_06350 [Beijerinckiaceae bacterium]